MKFGVKDQRRDAFWCASDYTLSLLVIAILGPLLTLIPTLVLTPRKYCRVPRRIR